MKTNVSIELDDEQRNRLACELAGKPVKRMATRQEVRDLVVAVVAGLVAEPASQATPLHLRRDLPPIPAEYADKDERWKRSYLRGCAQWIDRRSAS